MLRTIAGSRSDMDGYQPDEKLIDAIKAGKGLPPLNSNDTIFHNNFDGTATEIPIGHLQAISKDDLLSRDYLLGFYDGVMLMLKGPERGGD